MRTGIHSLSSAKNDYWCDFFEDSRRHVYHLPALYWPLGGQGAPMNTIWVPLAKTDPDKQVISSISVLPQPAVFFFPWVSWRRLSPQGVSLCKCHPLSYPPLTPASSQSKYLAEKEVASMKNEQRKSLCFGSVLFFISWCAGTDSLSGHFFFPHWVCRVCAWHVWLQCQVVCCFPALLSCHCAYTSFGWWINIILADKSHNVKRIIFF